ncbi:YicC family protein [bacterium]|nr:YicC family protein [candidate division CSSED10-310 bacterium]
MVYSMTGIGDGRVTENGFDVTVSVRSVNHRYFNLQIHMPRGYQRYEVVLRDAISRRITRGKVDVNVDFHSLPANTGELVINRGYGADLCREIKLLAMELNIPDGVTADRLVRFNDMFTSLPSKEKNTDLEAVLFRALDMALDEFLQSRLAEGTHLMKEMKGRVSGIRATLSQLRHSAGLQPGVVRERLMNAVQMISRDLTPDSKRLEEEVVIWAVRSDVTEELTRLESHLNRIEDILDSSRAVGKELDFTIQELHREITTIGSKSVMIEINQMVVTLKLEIEKLREQVQNLE